MKTFSFTGGGFWDGVMDKPLYDRIGAVREVMSFAELGNTVGDRVFSVRAVNGKYNPLSGEVGALLPFEMDAMSANSPLVRGVLLATGSKVATGQGTAVQLTPAVALGQRLYSALHVTAIGPTSIIVIVESDDNAGFTTPTTRLTHTTFTGGGTVGADWQELAGPVATDTYWRSKWTMVGAGPFTIFHTLGIL
jgi:hypothetical protein